MSLILTTGSIVSSALTLALLGACSSSGDSREATSTVSEPGPPLWSLLRVDADYDIVSTPEELVTKTDTQHTIRGTVVGAEPGARYNFDDGSAFESAFLTIEVAESDISGLGTATVEVAKPSSESADELEGATFGGGQVVFVVKSTPLFDVADVSDLNDQPDPESIFVVASMVQGALDVSGDSIVSLTTGDEVLRDAEVSSTNDLGDELIDELP